MDIQTIIVYAIFAICILCTIKWLLKKITRKGQGGCSCGCCGCNANKKENTSNCCSKNKG